MVDCYENPVKVGGEMAAYDHDRLQKIRKGELIGDISEFFFRDPNRFRAGELHSHFRNIGSTSHRKALLRSKHRFSDG